MPEFKSILNFLIILWFIKGSIIIANEPLFLAEKLNIVNEKSYELLQLKYDFNYGYINSKNQLNLLKDNLENISDLKSPWLAFFLSAIFPGAGQLYNGDYIKAIGQPLLVAGGVLLASTACFDCSSIDQPHVGVGLGIAFGAYLWSIIDAPISANLHNNRIQSKSGITLFSSDDKKYSINYNSLAVPNNHTLSLVLNF